MSSRPPKPSLLELEAKYFPSIPTVIPHSQDTLVLPYVDGEDYFAAIHAAIEGTEGTGDVIYISSWLFERQTHLIITPKTLGNLLVEKALNGVDVRLVVWAGRLALGTDGVPSDIGRTEFWLNRAAGAADLFVREVGANILNVRGLRAATTSPDISPPLEGRVVMDWSGDFGSRHQKYTVVYRKSTGDLRAFVGGMDFSEKNRIKFNHPANASPHDVGVECRGGAGLAVWRDFKTRWEEARDLPGAKYRSMGVEDFFNPTTSASLSVPPVPSPGTAVLTPVTSSSSVRIVRSYYDVKDTMLWGDDLPWITLPAGGLQEIFTVFQKALRAATRYIYIEDQGINESEDRIGHTKLWPLIIDALFKDVKVICVTSGEGDINRSVHPTILTFFDRAEVPSEVLRRFVMHRVDRMEIHSKVVLIDDEFLSIGSANFWNRSMTGADTELNAVIVDPGDMVMDLRVRLWADHLRVDPNDQNVLPELQDLSKSLGFFRPEWGTDLTLEAPDSKLQPMGP